MILSLASGGSSGYYLIGFDSPSGAAPHDPVTFYASSGTCLLFDAFYHTVSSIIGFFVPCFCVFTDGFSGSLVIFLFEWYRSLFSWVDLI